VIERSEIARKQAPRTERYELGLTAERPIRISRVVPRVAAVVEQDCGAAYWFIGELSSLRRGRGGWTFGSVSDGGTRVDLRFPPGAVHQVGPEAVGRLLLFRGTLRLDRAGCLGVVVIEARGVDTQGARLLAREELRRRLSGEGVLTRSRRALPEWPSTIAVVTAARGAAIEDIRAVIMRRAPWIRLVIYDSAVQGRTAPGSLAQALTAAGDSCADVIVLARGGGAAEDLAVFDDELVVRAVASSKIPLVCAVGHQTDNTVADEVADLSVATPTAAAERITPDRAALTSQLEQLRTRLRTAAEQYMRAKHSDLLSRARRAMPAMTRLLQLLERRLNGARPQVLAQRALRSIEARRRAATDALARCERLAERVVQLAHSDLKRRHEQLHDVAKRSVTSAWTHLQHQRERIVALSPEAILQRGYAIVRDRDGLCRSTAGLSPGVTVQIYFGDGMVTATISSTTLQKGRAA